MRLKEAQAGKRYWMCYGNDARQVEIVANKDGSTVVSGRNGKGYEFFNSFWGECYDVIPINEEPIAEPKKIVEPKKKWWEFWK